MKIYICQICGDAYLGEEKPKNCPFCGAREGFIKNGKDANPIVNRKLGLSKISKKNLEETLALEIRANAIYLCMAGKAKSYEIKAMYKRLAKVELEHAVICIKLLDKEMPEIKPEECSEEEIENFKKTIELEESASKLYLKFSKECPEEDMRILFVALEQAEKDHIKLMQNYSK